MAQAEGKTGSLLATISQGRTLRRPATPCSEAVREFLVEAGEVYGKQITAALVSIWQREFGHVAEPALRKAMRETFQSCRFFPAIADVMGKIPLTDRYPDLAGEMILLGPRLLKYPKPEPMTPEELKEHNAENIKLRMQIGPARKPRTSKEELQEAERALAEHETSATLIEKIDRQKETLKARGILP